MAAEAIPLINALLEAMGLTAAGSAKGTKYDVPEQVSKHASGALDAAAGLASKNPVKVVRGVKTMLTSGKAEAPKEAIKDENYDELPEDMKKDLADLVNKDFAGFGGDPDDKDKKPKKDEVAKAAGATKATESVVKNQPKKEKINYKDLTYEQRMALINKHLQEGPNVLDPDAAAKGLKQAQNRAWNKERGRTVDESEMKNAEEFRKPTPLHSQEAVDLSREHFMEGKPNSLDTDKAVSELHGQQKAKLRNRTVTQNASDILEHHRAPEDMRMTNKYSIKKDPIDEIKEENAPKFDSKFPAIAPIPVIIRILKEEFGMDDEDAEEVTDGINTIQYYDGNNASKEDKSIRDKMIDDLKKLLGFDIYQKVKDYSAEYYAEQAKKDAEKEGDN